MALQGSCNQHFKEKLFFKILTCSITRLSHKECELDHKTTII